MKDTEVKSYALESSREHQCVAREALRLVKNAGYTSARIASGWPASGSSDIDILVYENHRSEDQEERVTFFCQGREVNVLISGDARRLRSLRHRLVEIRATKTESPETVAQVVRMKVAGVKTEKAWQQALGLKGECCYTAVAALYS